MYSCVRVRVCVRASGESLRNLALIEMAAGQLKEAEAHLRRGLSLAEREGTREKERGGGGEAEAAVGVMASTLSICLQQQGRMSEAGELLQRMVEEGKGMWGE